MGGGGVGGVVSKSQYFFGFGGRSLGLAYVSTKNYSDPPPPTTRGSK